MKPLLLVLLVSIGMFATAQDKSVQTLKQESSKTIKKNITDTIPRIWRTGGILNLTFGQTSLSNWAAGGDNLSLNVNGLLTLFAYYKKGRHAWDNNLDLAVGYVKTTSLGTRKSDDRIDLTSKYGYDLGSKFYLTGLFNFRSQFFAGYNYPTDTTKDKISNFLAPAYVLISAGIDYKPTDYFSVFVSPVSSRWVIVKDDDLSAQGAYGVDTGSHSRYEMGAYLTAQFQKEIMKNVLYKSKLDLFSNYRHNPGNVDVYMTNLLSMKINKVLTASVGLDLIYDDDVRIFGPNGDGARLQVRENIGVGFGVKF